MTRADRPAVTGSARGAAYRRPARRGSRGAAGRGPAGGSHRKTLIPCGARPLSWCAMDLVLLRTFLAVHRAGSLTRAAVDPGLSQPAVTAQIRTLEQRVGVELFHRLPRGVAPTAAADELARAVAPHLDALAAVAHDALLPDDAARRVIRIGCPPSLTATLLLPALGPLLEEGLRVVVAGGRSDDLLAALAAGRLDLTLATTRPRIPGVSAVPLADEEYALVGAPR